MYPFGNDEREKKRIHLHIIHIIIITKTTITYKRTTTMDTMVLRAPPPGHRSTRFNIPRITGLAPRRRVVAAAVVKALARAK